MIPAGTQTNTDPIGRACAVITLHNHIAQPLSEQIAQHAEFMACQGRLGLNEDSQLCSALQVPLCPRQCLQQQALVLW